MRGDPIPVGKILFGAFVLPWRSRAWFARALAIPFIVLVALGLAQEYSMGRAPGLVVFALVVLYFLAFVAFAVTCHRLVLLEPAAIARERPLPWQSRNTRFLLRCLAVWLLCLGVGVLMSLLVAATGLIEAARGQWFVQSLSGLAVFLPVFYLLARLSPVFPATALDRNVGLRWAWTLTRGNGARMFVVVGVLPLLVSTAISLPLLGVPRAAASAVTSFLGSVLLVVEIAALSLAYRELTKDEATSAPPPASPRTA